MCGWQASQPSNEDNGRTMRQAMGLSGLRSAAGRRAQSTGPCAAGITWQPPPRPLSAATGAVGRCRIHPPKARRAAVPSPVRLAVLLCLAGLCALPAALAAADRAALATTFDKEIKPL